MENQLILLEDLGMQFATEKSKKKVRFGLFKCHCNNSFKAQISSVKNKSTSSCGCTKYLKSTKHGLKNHKLYAIWNSMISRCTNENNKSYYQYGARGIKVCDRWLNITNFIEDMYPTYQEGLSLDRINTKGNYEFDNCRWTTQIIQTRNTRVLKNTNTSGYRGVCWHKRDKQWRAQISVNYKKIHIGSFNEKIIAAKAYDAYVLNNNLEHTRNFS